MLKDNLQMGIEDREEILKRCMDCLENGAPRAKPVVPPLKYPTPLGAKALLCAATEASEGYPPVAKSAEATDFNPCQLKHGLHIHPRAKPVVFCVGG